MIRTVCAELLAPVYILFIVFSNEGVVTNQVVAEFSTELNVTAKSIGHTSMNCKYVLIYIIVYMGKGAVM